ncbi:hypothetical protein [Sphingomonas sp. PB4P5]|uniref:hypothetical protein n=1 Tax=Parasphingomonas puruogangriensis TaxID=3096155 RepID=UPI002FC63FA6
MTHRVRPVLPIAIIAILFGAIPYLSGGSTVYARHAAPDGQGVVELLTTARWRAWQVRDYEIPVVARFVEPDGTVVGPTAPFELVGNAQLRWDHDGVSIGTAATYERHSRRWSVEE